GLRVILDVAVNHLCDPQTTYRRRPQHRSCADALAARSWRGDRSEDSAQGELSFGPAFFPPLRSQHFFNRCGANVWDETAGAGAAAVYGDFVATMLDFDTRNRDFQGIFIDLYKYWLAYADVDGFRMDAAKHVTEDFVARFSTELRAHAQALGKDNLFIVGEVAADADWIGRRLGTMFSNPHNPDQHGDVPRSLTDMLWRLRDTYLQHPAAPYPGLNGAYDFFVSHTLRDVLLNRQPSASLEHSMGSAYARTLAAQNDSHLNWLHLEIHDWSRFASEARHDPWKSQLAVAALAVAPAIPVLYYGIEQGFNGDCHWDRMAVGAATDAIRRRCGTEDHTLNRQDMFVSGPWRLGSTVADIDDLAGIGVPAPRFAGAWDADPMLRRDHGVYQTARRFNRLRRTCAPLARGATYFRWVDAAADGVWAFSRIHGGVEVLVVVNTAAAARPVPPLLVDANLNSVAGAPYRNLLHPTATAVVRRQGPLSLLEMAAPIQGNSIQVFVPALHAAPFDPALGAAPCKNSAP
ncbi:MAG TPA: alpha-amylase family glycosyl hydrolase, partial [Myxococcota bacterium]|nr:alpha-amylase family glycosyl hydrolase [Myxococcota bacterium]